MKILLLTDGVFPFQIGGMQKHSLMLVKYFAQSKRYVHVIHCGGTGYDQNKFKNLFSNQELEFIEETVVEFLQTDVFPGHYVRDNKAYSKRIYSALGQQLKSYDVIYAQGFTGWEFIHRKKRSELLPPVLVNFHGLEMFQKAPSFKAKLEFALLKRAVKWNLIHADYVYSFGAKIDKILMELGVSKNVILQQVNGIQESWITDIQPISTSQIRKFVFLGRAERRKGIEELNHVLKKLIKQNCKFEFSFIGPIPKMNQIEDPKITYFGELRDIEQIKEILKQNDCLVCPSHSEGMPTVILEAMALGLAIIATDVGAIQKQVSTNGILIANADTKLLQDAMLRIISMDPIHLKEMKAESIRLIQDKFTWKKVIETKLIQFDEILQN